MKKYLAVMMALAMTVSGSTLALAGETEAEAGTEAEASTEAEVAELKGDGVMSYDEYMAAAVDDEVVVEAYVQAKQAWYENNEEAGTSTATVYAQDLTGGYFFYNMECSEEDYEALTEGTKIKVTGYKAEWAGEVEIADATFEIEEGEYVAEPVDVTEYLADEVTLIGCMNQKVSFTDMTVEAASEDDAEAAFLYNYDGSGSDGDDLYFNVSKDGNTYTFTVESYLCGPDTDVYQAVKELKVGDTVDLEGFLYWYEGVNPHITSVTVK